VEKPITTVILRSQQATKNLHMLEEVECRAFVPMKHLGAQDYRPRLAF
jgi:hypothetical protein